MSSEISSSGAADLPAQVSQYPASRYMGSKRRILGFLAAAFGSIEFETALDAFSGGGSVSYMLKALGKEVHSNDYLEYGHMLTKAVVENNSIVLRSRDLELLLSDDTESPSFIQDTFNGLYFSPEDNSFLDMVSGNIDRLDSPTKQALARAALCRAALKKQPRGVFTVVGHRYDDGRADLRMSMREQFLSSVEDYNDAVFRGERKCRSSVGDIMNFRRTEFDLVYLDPPYYSPHSDNDYLRRYHFVEGLATYWRAAQIIEDSKNKRLERRPTVFASKKSIYAAFEELFARFDRSVIAVSYSSNSLPTREELIEMLKRHGRSVEVLEADLTYSFGTHSHKVGSNRNAVQEYLFVARP